MANRTKKGTLKMLRKKDWCDYRFEVIGGIYLHYFKDQSSKKPHEQILLRGDYKVVQYSKGGTAAFEIHAKKTLWILEASSFREMIEWMEAIKPGSARGLQEDLERRDKLRYRNETPNVDLAQTWDASTFRNTGTNYGKAPEVDPRYVHMRKHSVPSENPGYVARQPVYHPEASSINPSQLNQPEEPRYVPVQHLHLPTDTRNCRAPSPDPMYTQMDPAHAQMNPSNPQRSPSNPQRSPSNCHNNPQMNPQNNQYVTMYSPVGQIASGSPSNHHSRQEPCRDTQPALVPHSQTQDSTPYRHSSDAANGYVTLTDGRTQHARNMSVKAPVSMDYPPERKLPSTSGTMTGEQPDGNRGPSPTPYAYVTGRQLDAVRSTFEDQREDMTPVGYMQLKQPSHAPVPAPRRFQKTAPTMKKQQSFQYFSLEQMNCIPNFIKQVSVHRQNRSTIPDNFEFGAQDLQDVLECITEDAIEDEFEGSDNWTKADAVPKSVTEEHDHLEEMSREALIIHENMLFQLKPIGKGNFGQVYHGFLKYTPDSVPIEVAVKAIKPSANSVELDSFTKEIITMASLLHPNVVKMHGYIEHGNSRQIVLEYLHLGDLRSFLQKPENKRSVRHLIKYMYDIAAGMHYLASKGLVHRDLAARNVLLSHEEVCKVADFGLLRQVDNQQEYVSQTSIGLPLRWMAPESVADSKFSTASDVWSFGILMWEMFNPLAKKPFDSYSNMDLMRKIPQGLVPDIPEVAPSNIVRLMQECWRLEPQKRPSFLLLSTLLFKYHIQM